MAMVRRFCTACAWKIVLHDLNKQGKQSLASRIEGGLIMKNAVMLDASSNAYTFQLLEILLC
jgi:hypothetical protein